MSIDKPPSGDAFYNALNNPLLTQTENLPPIDRFNISAYGSKVEPRKLNPRSIAKANERGAHLVDRAQDIFESSPQQGIHLEVGLGENLRGKALGWQMRIRLDEGHHYTADAPYIAVDGGAPVLGTDDYYTYPSQQKQTRDFFERANREMAEQGLSEAYQYRIGDGNDLAAAGIEDETVVELYTENVLFTMTNQEMHRMLTEFYRVMAPGGVLVIREYYHPVRLHSEQREGDLLPDSRGNDLGLAAALDAAGFTERGVNPEQPYLIAAFKSLPEVGVVKPKVFSHEWLRRINKRY